jgi:hypothetical protein
VYGKVVDEACRRMHLSVAFLSADGIAPWFGNNDESDYSREFDEARRKYLRQWRPDVILVAHRWEWDDAGTVKKNLQGLADELAPLGGRVVLVGQAPALRIGESVNLREFVSWSRSREGSIPRIAQDEGEPRRREILAMMEAFAHERPGVELLRVDDVFTLSDGTVRYAEGRKFYYADDDHLSQAGAELVQDRIADAIARNCKVSNPNGRRSETRVARLTPGEEPHF